ncbi:MAG: hypothetical protein ACOCZ5_02645 [bacterium]
MDNKINVEFDTNQIKNGTKMLIFTMKEMQTMEVLQKTHELLVEQLDIPFVVLNGHVDIVTDKDFITNDKFKKIVIQIIEEYQNREGLYENNN